MSNFPPRLAALEPFFGTWYLDAFLGEGSFGKVYRVRRKEFERVYYAALKWIPIPADEEEPLRHIQAGSNEQSIRSYYHDVVNSLQSEIVMMNALRGHSNIVSFEDHRVIERKDRIGYDVLIRMELLTPLPALIGKGMAIKDVVKLGLDICDALVLCDRMNIVHRDIKPDNIFLSEFGSFKLGDFGVARQLEHTQGAMSRKGTPNYMAPELMVGGTAGKEVDQYSLGLVLHNLLNGHRIPFVEVSSNLPTVAEREEACRRRLVGDPIPPPMLGSAKLKAAICKAAAYKAGERHKNAAALRAALLECVADLEDDTPLNTALIQGDRQAQPGFRSGSAAPAATPLTAPVSDNTEPLNKPEAKPPQGSSASAAAPPAGQAPRKRKGGRGLWYALGGLIAALGLMLFLVLNGQPPKAPETSPSPTIVLGNLLPVGTDTPTQPPTEGPTEAPTDAPTQAPTDAPTAEPTAEPTATPEPTPDPAREPVAFPHAWLEKEVRESLEMPEDAPITLADLAKVRSLSLKRMDITDISFLADFSGLEVLNLDWCRVEDLTPLASLKSLQFLNIAYNLITDLSPLQELSSLQSLYAGKNKITDLSPLASLPGLTQLVLHENQISDLSPLQALTALTHLDVSENPITSVEPIKGMLELETLCLSGIPVEDAAWIARLDKLNRLHMDRCGLTSIPPLTQARGLEALVLSGNQISDLRPLQRMEKLQSLYLDNNQVVALEPLAGLRSLQHLSLKNNAIRDLSPLSGLTNLTSLDLEGNPISSYVPLKPLTKLRYVDFDLSLRDVEPGPDPNKALVIFPSAEVEAMVREQLGVASDVAFTRTLAGKADTLTLSDLPVSDLAFLEDFSSLTNLTLHSCGISHLQPLAALSKLEMLNLVKNQISDVSPLGSLSNMQLLWLGSNRISDLGPLAALPRLYGLNLDANPLSDISPLAALHQLQWLSMMNTQVSDVSPLAALTDLWLLHLQGNQISDLAPLSGLHALATLYLDRNPIQSYAPLEPLKSLHDVDFDLALRDVVPGAEPTVEPSPAPPTEVPEGVLQFANPETENAVRTSLSLAPDALLTEELASSVETMDLSGTQLQSLDFLAHFPNLRSLKLSGCGIYKLEQLAPLVKLEELVLDHNRIEEVYPLKPLISLRSLSLKGNQITELSFFKSETELEYSHYKSFDEPGANPLAALTKLESLNLDDNRLTNALPLGSLKSLVALSLRGNSIRDFGFVTGMTGLQGLNVSGNPIWAYSPLLNHPGPLKTDVPLMNKSLPTDPQSKAVTKNLQLVEEEGTGIVRMSWQSTGDQASYIVSCRIAGKNPVDPQLRDFFTSEKSVSFGTLLPNTNYTFSVKDLSTGKTVSKDLKTKEAPYFEPQTKSLIDFAFYLSASDGGVRYSKSTTSGALRSKVSKPRTIQVDEFIGPDPNVGFELMGNGGLPESFGSATASVQMTTILLRLPNGHILFLEEDARGAKKDLYYDAHLVLRQIYTHYKTIPTGTWRAEIYYDRMLAGFGTLNVR